VKTYTGWPTPTGLGAAEMYAYETMFHAGVCALAGDRVVIGITIDSTRHKVTMEIAVFVDILVFRFISFSPFVAY
jgi:hypothetical protein